MTMGNYTLLLLFDGTLGYVQEVEKQDYWEFLITDIWVWIVEVVLQKVCMVEVHKFSIPT